jgi:hypothetical protein
MKFANGLELADVLERNRFKSRDTYMFFGAMYVDVEVFWRMQLRLQSRMLLWCLGNVNLSAIGTKELAKALSAVVRALVDCGGSRAGALIIDSVCSHRH